MIAGAKMADWTPAPMPAAAPQKAKREAKPRQQRGWIAARADKLQIFSAALKAEDEEIKRDIARLRAHSRDLARNNPIMARYLRLLQTNVIGHTGIQLQCNIRKGKKPLEAKNREFEDAWNAWGECCTTDGQSWLDVQNGSIARTAQDGETLFRIVFGPDFYCGIALEPVDADRLDHTYNDTSKRIVMGVEKNIWGKPIAYHIFTQHPDNPGEKIREKVSASEIIHLYRQQASRQTRGVSWAAPVMYLLNLMGRYWEAEVALAAHESSRAGFLTSKLGEFGETKDGEPPQDIELGPVTYIGLPAGVDPVLPDVKHPNTAFDPFSRAMLRLVASGLCVSHASLSNDRGDANYGSQRGGLIDERDNYRVLQVWLIQKLCVPIFRQWLVTARLTGVIRHFGNPCASWAGRGWDWIDPKNDIAAAIAALKAKIDSRTRILAQKGLVFRDVMQELADEEDFAKSLGISLEIDPPPAPANAPKDKAEEDDSESA